MYKSATISPCTKYRYQLWRIWEADKPFVMFIGLNPSTADAVKDDNTIKRCISFAKTWGFGGFCMVNLYAWRATVARDLLFQYYPEGKENMTHIRQCADVCALHVAMWGNGDILKHIGPYHAVYVREILETEGKTLFCLNQNADGEPGHLLYLKGDIIPILYNP